MWVYEYSHRMVSEIQFLFLITIFIKHQLFNNFTEISKFSIFLPLWSVFLWHIMGIKILIPLPGGVHLL